ncbi:MAG: 50S ribosomal protein L20 [Gemmatimonadetes bacterium]|nr:50S ribosomal protein L20 [Gemmatimonadota bacterium]
MPRVKSNPTRLKRKKQIMEHAKGFYGARSKLWRPAKEAVERAWRYAYRDRKNKKREFRRLWVIRINAGAHLNGLNYSNFIHGLMKAGIEIDRKILSDIAIQDPAAFAALADKARAALTEAA